MKFIYIIIFGLFGCKSINESRYKPCMYDFAGDKVPGYKDSKWVDYCEPCFNASSKEEIEICKNRGNFFRSNK